MNAIYGILWLGALLKWGDWRKLETILSNHPFLPIGRYTLSIPFIRSLSNVEILPARFR